MRITKKYLDELTYAVIGCAIEEHKNLGPGLLESVYEKCFMRELELKGIGYQSQLAIDLDYKGLFVDALLRFDVLVEDILLVELKSIEGFLPIHDAISLSYMRLLKKPKGILINFNCTNIFKNGQKTLVNDLYKLLPDY
jgi:GxxExxY protein